MICTKPGCGGKIQTTHTFDAGVHGMTRRSMCPRCKRSYTLIVTIVVTEPKAGQGAFALAKKLRNGKMKVGVHLSEPEEEVDPLASAETPVWCATPEER